MENIKKIGKMPSLDKPKGVSSKIKKRKPKSKKTKVSTATSPIRVDSETKMALALEKYPILKDDELVKKFMAVAINNNQKGRIRQILKDSLQGTSKKLLPDIINSKIQSILKGSPDLNETDLRKIRILYNMLKSAIQDDDEVPKETKHVTSKSDVQIKAEGDGKNKERTTEKGVKRYVVFLGNLPIGIDKEQIKQHFADISEHIKDIRIPERAQEKKSAIAYVELLNELSFELALSKHHSMLANKRINVLYSMQKNSNISKTEAKSKSAKLIALQKSGKLLGSIPLNRKRSHRRKKMKEALAKERND